MSTERVSFTIQGMFCANCAAKIESALTKLEGVVGAQVNYATERARVVYDPMRLRGSAILDAVRGAGFDVRKQRMGLDVGGLLYTTSPQFVERVLLRTQGVSHVVLDLRHEHVEIETFAAESTPHDFQKTLERLGFVSAFTPAKSAQRFVAHTIIAAVLALLIALSAGEHVGWLPTTTLIHLPFVVVTLSMFALFVTSLPFYHSALDAALQGEFDTGVLIALFSLASFLIGIPLALVAPTTWLTGIAFVIATSLTAGWFVSRAVTAFVLPRVSKRSATLSKPLVAPTQIQPTPNRSSN